MRRCTRKTKKKTKSRQQADQRVHLHSYTRTNAWTTQKHNNVVAHWMDGGGKQSVASRGKVNISGIKLEAEPATAVMQNVYQQICTMCSIISLHEDVPVHKLMTRTTL